MVASLFFGPTSELYKRLVVTEQKVDELAADAPDSVDPSLFTVLARIQESGRRRVRARSDSGHRSGKLVGLVPAASLADAKSHDRYAFARTLDSTERIAVVLEVPHYKRSYNTVNNYFRTMDSLGPADVQAAARKFFTDAGMIVTTLSKDALPAGIERAPALGSVAPAAAFPSASNSPTPSVQAGTAPPTPPAPAGAAQPRVVLQISVLPQVDVKLLFAAGSARRIRSGRKVWRR